jgi:hypothetical protein
MGVTLSFTNPANLGIMTVTTTPPPPPPKKKNSKSTGTMYQHIFDITLLKTVYIGHIIFAL